MVSILGNVKIQSEGTDSIVKDFSLLFSNPMGPIIASLRIYSLLDFHIQKVDFENPLYTFIWTYTFIIFFQNSTLHVYSRLHVYSERESTIDQNPTTLDRDILNYLDSADHATSKCRNASWGPEM